MASNPVWTALYAVALVTGVLFAAVHATVPAILCAFACLAILGRASCVDLWNDWRQKPLTK